MLTQNSTVTLWSGRVRIQLNERRYFPCVMVEKWTAVKCAKKIEPDRNIVFSSFAIPSSNRWAKLWWCAAGKRGERDVTRAYVQLHWDSERFWLVENATQKLPPAWAFEPLFKQKPCHKHPLWWRHNGLFYSNRQPSKGLFWTTSRLSLRVIKDKVDWDPQLSSVKLEERYPSVNGIKKHQ